MSVLAPDTVETTTSAPATRAQLTIVVPVFEEALNMNRLVRGDHDDFPYGIRHAVKDLGLTCVEVVFVDDSPSESCALASLAIARRLQHDGVTELYVKHIHRPETERHDGLSGAVVRGIREASSDTVIVMDGDLQHRPEHIPDMIQKLMGDVTIDLVVGSRYTEGGSNSGLSGLTRQIVSRGCTVLTKLALRDRMYGVTDPMTGFFALRKSRLRLDHLTPTGFKILLEILGTHQLFVTEVPIKFAERYAGVSKGDMENGKRFLLQLRRLRATVPVSPAA